MLLVKDKLELPARIRQAEHDAAVPVVVLERRKHRQTDHVAVERDYRLEVPRRTLDTHLHRATPRSREARPARSRAACRMRRRRAARRRGSPTAAACPARRGSAPPPGRRRAPPSRRRTSTAFRSTRRTFPPGACACGGDLWRRTRSARRSRACARSRPARSARRRGAPARRARADASSTRARRDERLGSPLHGGVEELRAARLRRRAVRVHHDLVVSVVSRLLHGARLDVHDAPGRHVDALRRVAEIHRQRPGKHDERLLLDRVPMPPALRARRVAPHAPAGMREPEYVAQPGDVAGNALALGLALNPLELVRTDHAEAHARHPTDEFQGNLVFYFMKPRTPRKETACPTSSISPRSAAWPFRRPIRIARSSSTSTRSASKCGRTTLSPTARCGGSRSPQRAPRPPSRSRRPWRAARLRSTAGSSSRLTTSRPTTPH